jgi:hypothetical protein
MPDDVEMVSETYAFCRRCAGRVDIGRVRVGTILTCPVCGFEFSTSRSPTHNKAGQARPIESASFAAFPPLRLFFSRTFTFPFHRAAIWQTAAVALLSMALVGVVRLGVWCFVADNELIEKSTRILLWNGQLFSVSSGALVAIVWTLIASAYGVTLLRETSEGCDVVREWPRLLVLEGRGESVHVVSGLLLSALPGCVLGLTCRWLQVETSVLIGGGMWLLFPLFLLSMLMANSPTHPVASRAWHSLFWAWHAWALFYLLTLGLAALALTVMSAAMTHTGWAISVTLAGIVLATVWMIYFRLLGRLAWFCSERFVKGDCPTEPTVDWPPLTHLAVMSHRTRMDMRH